MTTKGRYLIQVSNFINALNEQYYMSHDEYDGRANSLLHEVEMGSYSDDYVWGFADALRKVSDFFEDKV